MVKDCSDYQYDVIWDWYRKWLDLFDLINTVTGSDAPNSYPPPPSVDQEIQYLGLRRWFESHQDEFIPSYERNVHSREDDLPPEHENEMEIEEKYLENPFLPIYECENLYQWLSIWEIQDGIDDWKPDQEGAKYVRQFMFFFTRQLYEFLYDEILIPQWNGN